MKTLEDEFNLFTLLKDSFPDLDQAGLVIGIDEFVSGAGDLEDFICKPGLVREAATKYILAKKPYLIFDTSEGYPCFFFRGNFLKIQYDAREQKIIRLADKTTDEGSF